MGFLLPALLAVVAAVSAIPCPARLAAFCTIDTNNPFANLTYLVLLTFALGVLLLSLNHVAYQVLEGYLPPISWLAPLTAWHKRKFNALAAREKDLSDKGDRSAADSVRLDQLTRYPSHEDEILPTRFGNTIRAFESYSRDVYGADPISTWPRLVAVIPKEFQEQINDARAQVDFFVNLVLLSAVFAVAAVAMLLVAWAQAHFAAWPANLQHLSTVALAALAIAYVSYLRSIERIDDWGDLVKSAFDCYLPALGKQLGYKVPVDSNRRRRFWIDFSILAIYRIPFAVRKRRLASKRPPAPSVARRQRRPRRSIRGQP